MRKISRERVIQLARDLLDAMVRMKSVTLEEAWAQLRTSGFNHQYEDGWLTIHPEKVLVGRVLTAQWLPGRPDIHRVIEAQGKKDGRIGGQNAWPVDMLQPGDVLVVDLFGKKVGGTIVGDNLFFYVNQATHGGGLVVDGSIRDLDGISEIDMPAYFRSVDPTPIGNVMLTGINIPIRIGNVTVMPGDLVVGDREGVYFVPPQFVPEVLDKADETHIHDEWTKKKFAEGKYKSTEIYGSPRDPKLKQEYEEYLKKRRDEIHKQRSAK